MGPISGRKMILLDAPLEVLLGRLGLWFRTWTVGSPAKGAFTLQDDSGGGEEKARRAGAEEAAHADWPGTRTLCFE